MNDAVINAFALWYGGDAPNLAAIIACTFITMNVFGFLAFRDGENFMLIATCALLGIVFGPILFLVAPAVLMVAPLIIYMFVSKK